MSGGDAQLMTIEGWAFPPRSSQKTTATLAVEGFSVRLTDPEGAQLTEASRAKLKVAAPMGQAPRQVKFPDGTLFETSNSPAVDGLATNEWGNWLHSAERFGPRLLWVVLASIAGVFLIWRFALPVLVAIAVFMTPDPLVRAIDRGTLQTVDLTIAEPTSLSDERQKAVQAES